MSFQEQHFHTTTLRTLEITMFLLALTKKNLRMLNIWNMCVLSQQNKKSNPIQYLNYYMVQFHPSFAHNWYLAEQPSSQFIYQMWGFILQRGVISTIILLMKAGKYFIDGNLTLNMFEEKAFIKHDGQYPSNWKMQIIIWGVFLDIFCGRVFCSCSLSYKTNLLCFWSIKIWS